MSKLSGGFHRWAAPCACVALSVLLSPFARAQEYTITDLGTLGGGYSKAFDINNAGQVVGEADNTNGARLPFLWQSGAMTNLGTLSGFPGGGRAQSINASGTVGGVSFVDGNSYQAFVWQNGVMTPVGTLPGYGNSESAILNDNGEACVNALNGVGDSAFRSHPFLWSAGVITDPAIPNAIHSEAINNAGQITGFRSTQNGFAHGFLWDNGSLTDIGTLPGYNYSYPEDMNDAGQIVGSLFNNPGNLLSGHAFLWKNGAMTDLGTLGGSISYSIGINQSGIVVGSASTATGSLHAFLFSGGTMEDLNTLIPGDSGWSLTEAQAINDVGQIIGDGTIGGQQHAFLLTPISAAAPEPSTSALVAIGLIALFAIFVVRRYRSA